MTTVRVYNYDNVYWRVVFADPNRRPKRKSRFLKKSEHSRSEADQWAFSTLAEHTKGHIDLWGHKNKSNLSVEDAIQLFTKRATQTLAPSTLQTRLYILNKFKRDFGNALIDNLRSDYLNQYVNAPQSLKTREARRTMLNSLYEALREYGYDYQVKIKVLSTKAERNVGKQIGRHQWITEEELEKVCQAHTELTEKGSYSKYLRINRQLPYLFRIGFYTGFRRADLIHLSPEWINGYESITIGGDYVPKSQKNYETVALLPKAVEVLKECEHLLPIQVTPDHLSKRFKKAVRKALPNKPDIHLHSLRHSFVMYCLDTLHLPERIVKQLTRHEDDRSFRFYTHSNVDHVIKFLRNNEA